MELKRIPRWVRTRLTLPKYISVRLLLGFLITLLCVYLLGHLVSEVIFEQDVQFDTVFANEIHAAATPAATSFFRVVTMLGFEILWVIGIGVGVFFIWRRKWLRLGVWIAALVGGEILDLLLKNLFARPRPTFADPLATALFYSFPSGHATMSLITYGFLAYLFFVSLKHAALRVLISAALILLTLLIGFSRIYLGVHYVSDVLAGFAVGGLWLSFCITSMHLILQRRAWRERKTGSN